MTAQPSLPGFAPLPARPRRRPAWQAELRRLVAILAALDGQLADLRHRLAEVERAAGLADLARAPARNDGLRRFAGRLA